MAKPQNTNLKLKETWRYIKHHTILFVYNFLNPSDL